MQILSYLGQTGRTQLASQTLEIKPFRLTHPFRLAYTPLTAVCGVLGKRAAWQTLISMNFLSRAVRYLFWLLLISWSVWLLRRFVGGMLNTVNAPQRPGDASAEVPMPGPGRRLVRDPICGTHVDETLSVPLGDQGEVLHFCSMACRDAYAEGIRKVAANG
jgi:YHS domain-containing protein